MPFFKKSFLILSEMRDGSHLGHLSPLVPDPLSHLQYLCSCVVINTAFKLTRGLVSKETVWCCVGGEVKHKSLDLSTELLR